MYHTAFTMVLYALAQVPAPTRPAPQADTVANAGEQQLEPADRLLALLEQANRDADEDPLRTIELLRTELENFSLFEQTYIHNPRALELRTLSQLNLARAQLATSDELGASETIQAAIRDQHGGTLPAERLGPTVTGFYLEQRDLLLSEGRATVSLMYATPCEFVINGKLVDTLIIKLPLGAYRVHIRALDGSAEFHETLELTKDREVVVIEPGLSGDASPDAAVEPDLHPRVRSPASTAARSAPAPRVATKLLRAAKTKKAGTVMLGVGGGLMLLGTLSMVAGAATYNRSYSELAYTFGFEVGGAMLGIGGGTLIIGAITHGAAAEIKRQAAREASRLSRITPVVGFDRNSAHVGVSMRF